MDYADAETLYSMMQYMSLHSGIVSRLLTGQSYDPLRQKCGYVYLIGAREIPGKYKIGITRDMSRRLHDLRTIVPIIFYVIHFFRSQNPRSVETTLHRHFIDKRIVGEWFALDKEDIAFISNIKDNDSLWALA